MKKQDADLLLKELILLREAELQVEVQLLKEHFHITYESLKPANIIKNKIKEIISSPGLKTNIVDSAIGLTTGFIAKNIFAGRSHNPITKLLGLILEVVVTNKATKNADEIKSIGSIILSKIFKRSGNSEKV